MQKENTGIRASQGRSHQAIELIAAAWRVRLGYQMIEPFDALDFFNNKLGDVQIETPQGLINVVEHVGSCQQEGSTRYDTEHSRLEVVLSQETHKQLTVGNTRARFTTCHEFGHAVLHTQELMKLAGLPLTVTAALHRQREYPVFFDSEWQANAFAGALLMPAQGVRELGKKVGLISTQTIMHQFQVSFQAANIRIETLTKF